ncbi:MAG: glutamyl-tRNA reductase [Deltaproteobacteria bacterium]|nr:glutamyl-tRNA reductase [Deltaproteobacteria bacterium]
MNLSLLSISYKTTPVDIRERLDIPAGELPELLPRLKAQAGLNELMVVSTCNRVEFYFAAARESTALQGLMTWAVERAGGGDAARHLEQAALRLDHQAALNHLFRVACSLESMVVGEPQILGQVKDAYHTAVEAGTVGPLFKGLMPRVFRAAKRVRTETGISRFAVSISYAAVELAGKIFDSLAERTVLVIGAGEMAELALAHLLKAGIGRLLLVNRTYAGAVALAEKHQGQAMPWESMDEALAMADIVLSSTGARGFVITPEQVKTAMKARKREPMFFIDIAVPRDIDPAVNNLPNVYCYDIDDLKNVTNQNRQEREREAHLAQRIVEEEQNRYLGWAEALSVVPTIKALREAFAQVAGREVEKALPRLSGSPAKDGLLLERTAQAIVKKLLHFPSTHIKQVAEEGDGRLYAEILAAAFGLDPDQCRGDGLLGGAGENSDSAESGDSSETLGPSLNVVPFPKPSSRG